MLCKDVMEKNVPCVFPETTVAAAAKVMDLNHIGWLAVCDGDGVPLGVLTGGDIAVRVVARERPAAFTRVGDVMTAPPLFVSPDAPAERIAELMKHEGKSRLLVIDGQGKLDGVVNLSDLLLVAPSELSLAAAQAVLGTVHRPAIHADNARAAAYETAAPELTEPDNPARAEAANVVQGGTNELKEFPG